MCDMIPGSEHWRLSLAEAQSLQHAIMGYLPGFATPRVVCDVPYVGKRWVHQVARYDTERGISYWTKNYRTAIETDDELALEPRVPVLRPDLPAPRSGPGLVAGHSLPAAGRRLGPQPGRRRRLSRPGAVRGTFATRTKFVLRNYCVSRNLALTVEP